MRFVTVRDFRSRPADIWKNLPREQEMVITSNGKPVALLTPVTDQNLEGTLSQMRRARAAAAVSSLQDRSIKSGRNRLSLADINREIELARKEIRD
jgi:prevent-host-death family protein